jgi:2-keto-4-pentenoate hydratase/2-oxohepta-3-ene-1,7-dioic acid hydratase in catechol pathway
MGSDPTRESPLFFQKPTDAVQIVPSGVTVDHPYPSLTKNHHFQMIWSVAEQISKLSQAFGLMRGDVIYSGTPENVGPVVRGDIMTGHIDRLPDVSVKLV